MTHWIDRLIEKHTGPFLEPEGDDSNVVNVTCATHGFICRASFGAEIYCVGCKEWLDTLKLAPDGTQVKGALDVRQDAMKRRLARKSRRRKK